MSALAARIEFVLTGEATGGTCPDCGRTELTLHEGGVDCAACDFSRPLPEVPGWL